MSKDSATSQGGGLHDLATANALDPRVRVTMTERRAVRAERRYRTAEMGALHTSRHGRPRDSSGQLGILSCALASEHTHERAKTDPDTLRMTMLSYLGGSGPNMAQAGGRRQALTRTSVQLPMSSARRWG